MVELLMVMCNLSLKFSLLHGVGTVANVAQIYKAVSREDLQASELDVCT